ncbi:hypothetical protein MTR_2g088140 [Medicago truncatula]|uniref:Uncharacterized protein n=1 Tax=Medicago truncatula TaxID=3880 RepID=G7ITX3_MEDTR|nr:hypothetical protein MTR_2g088140 [Medicago truncatula]
MIFKVKECSIIHVVDKIKSLSFMWLKAKFTSLPLNYYGWWLYPFIMLGIADAFNHRRIDVTEFGQVISACQSLFNTNFSNSKVEFNRRQANEVAHTYVGVATLSSSPNIYYHVPRLYKLSYYY